MPHPLLASSTETSYPIWLVTEETWPGIADSLAPQARAFAGAQGFEAKSGSFCLLPNAEGGLLGALFGIDGPGAKRVDPFLPGKLVTLLPEGVYRFETTPPDPTLATLAWLLGGYSFTRYRKRPTKAVRLVTPQGVDGGEVARIAEAVCASRSSPTMLVKVAPWRSASLRAAASMPSGPRSLVGVLTRSRLAHTASAMRATSPRSTPCGVTRRTAFVGRLR